MKRLLGQAGLALLVAAAGSCGAGFLVSRAGGSGEVTAMRDVGIIILALFSLVGSMILAAIGFAGAWAIDRFGAKVIGAVQWVGRKELAIERGVEGGLDRFAVRPTARVARALTIGTRFPAAVARRAQRLDALARGHSTAVRGGDRTPLGEAER